MHLEVIKESAALEKIASQWQALEKKCPTATVFQTHAWNSSWWRHFGRRYGRRLYVMLWRDHQGGPLVGLAPMMASWWYGTPILRFTFLGTGASDYLDVLALPSREREVADAFYAANQRRILDLPQLREGSLLGASNPAVPLKLQWQDVAQEACPFLPLPDTWDALLSTFGKKTRTNISYYERALRKVFEVEIGYVTQEIHLRREMTRLFELHQRRWNQRWLPGVFGSQRVQAFHQDAARSLFHQGALRLFTLKLDDETQAVLYCFKFGDRLCYYQGGFEPTYAKWSLGTILTAFAMQTAISDGVAVFDFLRGDEPYKAKWTQTSAMNNRRLIVPKRSPFGPLAEAIFKSEVDVERRVKAWLRRKKG